MQEPDWRLVVSARGLVTWRRFLERGGQFPGPGGADPVRCRAVIRLPPEITFDKRPLSADGWSYDFRHRALGALGRILLRDLPGGRGIHVSCEVAGDPADPRTAERRAIFEPLGLEIARQMEEAMGPYAGQQLPTPPARPAEPTEVVESKLMQCRRCDAFVAMLVFAPGATDAGRFEDHARMMYPECSQRDLPTWIIGPALGPGLEDSADIMQVWPKRKQIQRLTPGQFNPRLDRLATRHCRRAR